MAQTATRIIREQSDSRTPDFKAPPKAMQVKARLERDRRKACHGDVTPCERHVEADVRAFAAQYPTPSVLSALGHCESGRLSWEKVHALFQRSLAAGVMAVQGS